jgi:hypothetical protein
MHYLLYIFYPQAGLRATSAALLLAHASPQVWGQFTTRPQEGHIAQPRKAATAAVGIASHTPRQLLLKRYQVSADPENEGCFQYRMEAGDTLEAISKAMGVSMKELKEKNSKVIQGSPSGLTNKQILICTTKGGWSTAA